MEMAGKTKVGKIDLKPNIPRCMPLFFGKFGFAGNLLCCYFTNSCNEVDQETMISFSLILSGKIHTRFNLTRLHGDSEIL